ncbi:aspartate aminotransferase family protein [Paucilactobacillus suebicus]|uniref:4-aminobutyrate aminotransferase n=1 Tax=Paucilactobacillus suebicus DSM 5007 = KCTC 3549 TaxID=1423807 RepID=A0A0R1W4A2_9LACO|nr:aspartate aminotransferase family protein [Paucilactobacillus suebicus]KRM12429.1 4-aminobutyrate aminotransferase [Paucilactobacillus suebicus DSM 5007 = KCTC 3549]
MSQSENEKLLAEETSAYSSAARVKYYNIVIKSGKGATITDANDRTYIDLLASASATNTGHSHPHVVKAIQDQAAKLIEYTPAYFANDQGARLAPRLTKLAPISGPVELAWGNSGSDANDAIIKYSRAYTGRQYVVSFTGAYHGSTYGSMTVSSVSLNMSRKIGPLLPGVVKVPYPDPWQKLKGESEDDFVERMFNAFKLPFETYLPAEEVAVILIEPIQGDGGICKAPTEYIKKVYQFAHEHGILFAVDEVNQGMGRTGKWWSIERFGVEPDLMSVGKSLASGLPLSAVMGRAEIMNSLESPAHVFTTAGNPVSCAAANATIDVIEDEHLLDRSTKLGKLAEDFFNDAKKKYDFIGDVRMYGLDGGIDIIDPKTGKGDDEATTKLIYRIFELGAIIISLRGNVLRFQPPLVITEEQLKQAFKIIDQAFSELKEGKLSLPDNADEIGW